MIEVRRVREDEWRKLRRIRIEALTDSPDAFITTAAEALAYPDAIWRDRARMGARGEGQVTAIAVDGDMVVGMAIGLLRPDVSPEVVPVVGVFVSKPARRRGIAAAMLELIENWARERGVTKATLWVVDTNGGATRFYESIGYEATPDRKLVPAPPTRWETRYDKQL